MEEQVKKEKKYSPFIIVLFSIFALYVVILFGLLLWAILASFITKGTFEDHGISFANGGFTLENYTEVWQAFSMSKYDLQRIVSASGKVSMQFIPQADKAGFGEIVFNSIAYALGSAFLQTLVVSVTAYCCARYRYVFSKIVYSTVLVLMMVPLVGTQPSSIALSQQIGFYGKMWGIWIMNASFLGMYFLVLHDVYASMPTSFFEAARIDGANDIQQLTNIAVPLSINVFMTVLLINFITYWNDYQTPLLYIKGNPVLAYSLLGITTDLVDIDGYRIGTPMKMSASLIVLAPIVVLFCFTNKRLMGNLTLGGVKG